VNNTLSGNLYPVSRAALQAVRNCEAEIVRADA
jgi:hypothetical protein